MPKKYHRIGVSEEESARGAAVAPVGDTGAFSRRHDPKTSSFPLHHRVWDNEPEHLSRLLSSESHDLEKEDTSGRTALRLAVVLGRRECVEVLLDAGADAVQPDGDGWTPVHDATASGNKDILRRILQDRNFVLQTEAEDTVPQLLQHLEESPDFYVEMSWDFSSWIPLLSRMTPSDTYRIWKKGSTVRVDTTLLGFEGMKWQRGRRSFIFSAQQGGASAQSGAPAVQVNVEMVQIDHENRFAFREAIGVGAGGAGPVTEEEIGARLAAPVVTTTSDPDAVGFSRAKSGFWGWQSDKVEDIDGCTCKVYDASGMEVVTKTRLEHLPRGHPARKKKGGQTPLAQALHGLTGDEGGSARASDMLESCEESEPDTLDSIAEPHDLSSGGAGAFVGSFEDYVAGKPGLVVGRQREIRTQRQKFKARLSMSEEFPLSLKDQILPILKLLAPTSQHLAKLHDFVSLQLPPGFPVKVEIPVHQVLSARVTFHSFSSSLGEDGAHDLFSIPPGYRQSAAGDSLDALSQEDAMLALALQQSLHSHATSDFEAAPSSDQFDADLQRALLASLGDDGPVAAGFPVATRDAAQATSPARCRQNTKVWACVACTFENQPLVLACEVCGTHRPAPETSATDHGAATEEEMFEQALRLSMLES